MTLQLGTGGHVMNPQQGTLEKTDQLHAILKRNGSRYEGIAEWRATYRPTAPIVQDDRSFVGATTVTTITEPATVALTIPLTAEPVAGGAWRIAIDTFVDQHLRTSGGVGTLDYKVLAGGALKVMSYGRMQDGRETFSLNPDDEGGVAWLKLDFTTMIPASDAKAAVVVPVTGRDGLGAFKYTATLCYTQVCSQTP